MKELNGRQNSKENIFTTSEYQLFFKTKYKKHAIHKGKPDKFNYTTIKNFSISTEIDTIKKWKDTQ